jgi:hypothetical protein
MLHRKAIFVSTEMAPLGAEFSTRTALGPDLASVEGQIQAGERG